MIKKFVFLLFVVLSFSSCVEDNKKIKITTSTWIGYAPLFYAKEKNWKKKNIVYNISMGYWKVGD